MGFKITIKVLKHFSFKIYIFFCVFKVSWDCFIVSTYACPCVRKKYCIFKAIKDRILLFKL